MRKISDQIQSVETKQQQLLNRLSNLKSRQARIEKARETRRLVLAGKWMFKLNGGDAKRVGMRLAEAGLLSGKDRSLFGLDGAD